jgi:hypothetical protein
VLVPSLKRKLYTDKLLSQVSHRKTAVTETTIEIRLPTINPTTHTATLIQEGCVGRHLAVFQCPHNHLSAKFKFWELLDSTLYIYPFTLLINSFDTV